MSPLLQTPLTVENALLGFMRDEPLHGYETVSYTHLTLPTSDLV